MSFHVSIVDFLEALVLQNLLGFFGEQNANPLKTRHTVYHKTKLQAVDIWSIQVQIQTKILFTEALTSNDTFLDSCCNLKTQKTIRISRANLQPLPILSKESRI